MDNPKAPDDCRNWDSIDIFLFTNGEEYSPPRKYHLKAEELKWWDDTLNFLARSQFGSMHSNIELYSLDGKKINTPLELVHEAAYVAVHPPDSFIQSGYEEYILKASRSREKRNERLNNPETTKPADIETNQEPVPSNFNIPNNVITSYWKNIEDHLRFVTKINNLETTDNTSQNETKNRPQFKTTNTFKRNEKPELRQKQKLGNSSRNTIFTKVYPNSQRKEKTERTTYFPKNLMKYNNNNNKKLAIPSNNRNIVNTNSEDTNKLKQKPQKPAENQLEIKEKPEQLKSNFALTKSSLGNSEKELIVSNIYKNTEIDEQPVFLDTNRKTALLNDSQTKLPHKSENIEELGDTTKNLLKSSTALSQQSKSNNQALHTNQPSTFNINLNINVKGNTLFKTDVETYEDKCKTYTTMIKPEKASQINVDIKLSRGSLNFGNESLFREKPVETSIAKIQNEKISDDIAKVIVHCKCHLLESDKNTSPPCEFKGNDHYLIIISTEKMDKFIPRDDLHTRQGPDKEIQELLQSCIRSPTPSKSKTLNIIPENKNSLALKAPKEIIFDNIILKSQGDIEQPILTNGLNKTNNKVDNFAQTDWYNTLLQAKCQGDGHYTFHLPPLQLLTHYNLL